MEKNSIPITVLITTFNSERLIKGCLESASFAGEILIVDSGSTDDTLKICKEFGCRILQHKYEYSAKQKNWAIPQARYDWVLVLDTDERITSRLRQSIKENIIGLDKTKTRGFLIARRHYFMGKALRFGGRYPLYNIRLFEKGCRYEDRNVHAHIILPKKQIKKLTGDILHYSDRTMEQVLEKLNRYTTYQAEYIIKVRKNGLRVLRPEVIFNYLALKAVVKDLWYFIPGFFVWRFVYMYVLRLGFLDGKYGFIIAFLYSFSDYVAKVKSKELEQKLGLRYSYHQHIQNFGIRVLNVLIPKGERNMRQGRLT